MTWGRLKKITLQKIDEDTADGQAEYGPLMTAPANEALQLLSTAGKYIVKTYEIAQDGAGAGTRRYDLRQLLPDFYSLDKIYDEKGLTLHWRLEGGRTLALDEAKAGAWLIYYNAYPEQITDQTEEEAELPIDPEVAALIPLYIASQIYKHDDIALATMWRNEFEAGREILISKYQNRLEGQAEFMDTVW